MNSSCNIRDGDRLSGVLYPVTFGFYVFVYDAYLERPCAVMLWYKQ